MKRMLPAALVAAALCVSAGCDDETDVGAPPPDPPTEADLATAEFRDALEREDYAAIGALVERLEAARQSEPDRTDLPILIGLAHLWRLAEWGRYPDQDEAEMPTVAFACVDAFEDALALNPDDARILGWLGTTLVSIGNAVDSDQFRSDGFNLIDQGVAAYPEFNLFVYAGARDDEGPTSPAFADALEAYWRTLDECLGTTVNRDAFDMTPYLHLETTTGPKRVCWNPPYAPHNVEGFFLFMGDMLLKAGDVPKARSVYRAATMSSGYDTWPFKDMLQDRMSSAEQRAALFMDADPSNDPESIGETERQCAACHAK